MTVAYRTAIAEGKAHVGDAWKGSYVTFGPGGIEEVRCSCCSTVIRKLIPHDQPTIRRLGAQTIISERMVLACLPTYREVLLQMDDGSRHVTNVCVDCVPRLQANEFSLTALYAMDLSQWSSEGHRLADNVCERRPVSVLKADFYIKE